MKILFVPLLVISSSIMFGRDTKREREHQAHKDRNDEKSEPGRVS
jgi:hypothetical protein